MEKPEMNIFDYGRTLIYQPNYNASNGKVLVKKWVGKYSIIYTASKLCVAMSFTV